MTLQELSDLLQQLLTEHKSVSLPGMGRFVLESTPSQLLNEGKSITPPSKRIVFDTSSYTNPDTLLVDAYSRYRGIEEKDAVNEITDLLRRLKKELIDNAFVELPGFGIIKYGSHGSFVFEADAGYNPGACYFGLEPLAIMPKKIGEEFPVVGSVEEPLVAEVEQVERAAEVERVIEVEQIVQDEEEQSAEKLLGRGKIVIIVVVVLAALLLVVAVLVIFKEQFMPLWERLLYSKEELEILRRAGKL